MSIVIAHLFCPLFFLFSSLFLWMRDLRFSSKAGIVIEFNCFEPGFDVFAGFGMLAWFVASAKALN